MLIGVTTNHMPYFAVVTNERPGQPDLGATVHVERRRRNDTRWVLRLELKTRNLTDAFIALLAEVATKCSMATSERTGLKLFLETLSDWQALLQAHTEHISEGRLRGLVAELWFGFQSGAHEHQLTAAVNAWGGPLGGQQDFEFPSPTGPVEVKSLRPTSTVVEISSSDQLDGDGVHLAVVTLEDVANAHGGLNLPDQVHQIRDSLTDGADRAEFNRRFAELFVNLDDPWYREHGFVVQRLQIFEVTPQFPAIRRSQLPPAIHRTKYHLDLTFVSDFVAVDVSYT